VKRYLILFNAVIMQLCLGATYSWSVYVSPLKVLTGLPQGPVQLPFSIFYFAFPATMLFAGALLLRLGPRRCAVLGGILFGSGWLLAVLGKIHFIFTILGIGLLAGIGVGLAYIVPIAVCIQWFPRHKGLVTGIAVAGFGGGAALVSQAGGWLINSRGMTPFEAFGVFGVCFMLLVSLAGLNMQYAPDVARKGIGQLKIREVISRKEFRILYGAMFTGLAAGFAVTANLKELAPNQNLKFGILAVSLFAIANALGRVCWGALFDRIQSATAIRINLFSQMLVLLLMPWLILLPAGLLIFALLTGFNYGGVLVIYASATARIWGHEQVGPIYGILFSANILAALSPVIAGLAYDITGNFNLIMRVLALLLGVSALCIWMNASGLNADSPDESTTKMG